ncbi:MAG: hypothetical protein QOI78_2071 [Actinomycetota bacterium]|nr:hypothetical protein [Actinomycetota bacterium]
MCLVDAELNLLALLAEGLPVETIARRLDLSDRTVRRRLRSICDRLGCTATLSDPGQDPCPPSKAHVASQNNRPSQELLCATDPSTSSPSSR